MFKDVSFNTLTKIVLVISFEYVILTFVFIKSPSLRGLIILIAGYLSSFATDYRDIIILATISAVAPLALINGSWQVALERIMYVIIGIVLALLANRFILRKSQKEYNKE